MNIVTLRTLKRVTAGSIAWRCHNQGYLLLPLGRQICLKATHSLVTPLGYSIHNLLSYSLYYST